MVGLEGKLVRLASVLWEVWLVVLTVDALFAGWKETWCRGRMKEGEGEKLGGEVVDLGTYMDPGSLPRHQIRFGRRDRRLRR